MDNKDFEELDPRELSIDEILSDDFLKELNLYETDLPVEQDTEVQEEPLLETTAVYSDEELPPEKMVRQLHKKEHKQPWQKTALVYMHDLVYFLAAIVLVFLLCFRVVVVSGTSMNGTLNDGDYLLLVSDLFYRKPQPGDIIVASKDSFDNGAPIVKRVIAVAGQMVDIDFNKGIVFVSDDGGVSWRELDEPYTKTPTNVYEGVDFPVMVEDGCVFVMGDNRNDSKDSRNPQIGLIDCREILGRVVFLFYPGTNYGQEQLDFNRIGVVS